jgi:hypothetical protein
MAKIKEVKELRLDDLEIAEAKYACVRLVRILMSWRIAFVRWVFWNPLLFANLIPLIDTK